MNYKRHNQGYRAHVRRKYLGGYWLPKWARDKNGVITLAVDEEVGVAVTHSPRKRKRGSNPLSSQKLHG